MSRSKIIPLASAMTTRAAFQAVPKRSFFTLPRALGSQRSTIPSSQVQACLKHTIPKPPASASAASTPTSPQTTPPANPNTNPSTPPTNSPPPQYELTFTCVPCGTRSQHVISKQGYHHGSVLVACPSCKNRHVISDKLKIFGETGRNIEELLREKGQLVKRGTLGTDGDLEFWDDGSETSREERRDKEDVRAHEKAQDNATGAAPGESFGKATGN